MRVFGVENTATLRSCRKSLTRVEPVVVAALDEAVSAMAAGKADALALGRESLVALLPRLPGSRILPGHFHAAGTAIAVPLGRPDWHSLQRSSSKPRPTEPSAAPSMQAASPTLLWLPPVGCPDRASNGLGA